MSLLKVFLTCKMEQMDQEIEKWGHMTVFLRSVLNLPLNEQYSWLRFQLQVRMTVDDPQSSIFSHGRRWSKIGVVLHIKRVYFGCKSTLTCFPPYGGHYFLEFR